MEPRIQFAKTSDGVSIAYASEGKGRTVLVVPSVPFSHVQRRFFSQPLAERFHSIRYDSRGSGLSDREAIDFSMDAMVRDVEAVIEGAGLTGFAMVNVGQSPIAVTYAANRPEKISSLILVDGWTKYSDYHQNPAAIVAEESLRSGDWMLYTETLARVLMGFENQELAAQYGAYVRECVEPEALRAAFSSMGNEDWDVSGLLPRVASRTLVVHNRNNRFLPVQVGQRLAAGIPNARFQVVDDMNYEQLPGIIKEFLSESDEIAPHRIDGVPSGTAIILFADIADSTALTERLGDAAFREKARELDEALRRAISSNGGTAIEGKLLGDGVLATFGAAREAIACAMAIHRMAGSGVKGQGSSPDEALLLHVGIHAGDVIREQNNVYGGAVNIAARVAGEAAAGETLVSATVRELARTSAGVSFEDRGERELKGVGEPVRVWAVREAEGRDD